jgi:ribonuclease HI
MAPKPVPLPQRTPVAPAATPPIPSVAVKIAARGGTYFFCAATQTRSWRGSVSAANRSTALLEIFSALRSSLGVTRIRALLSLPPDSRVWRHVADFAAIGCLVERASYYDHALAEAAREGLRELLLPVETALDVVPPSGRTLTVATDGSVRKAFTGHGWLAADGRYGLRGQTNPVAVGPQAVLLAELEAISDAVQQLRGDALILLIDSTSAICVVEQWMDGAQCLPHGFPSTVAGNPSPLIAVREQIYANRARLSCRWVRAHCGDPLNEGADALARLASRYVRGDSGLSEAQYARRAEGLAEAFSTEFSRRSA